MALPTYKTLADLRGEIAARVGFGGMTASSQNAAKLNDILNDAQESLYMRLRDTRLLYQGDADHWVAPGESSIAYPDELDPDRIMEILVDYNNDGEWYPLSNGISHVHDSIEDTTSWPRRYERNYAAIDLWPIADVGATNTIQGISNANPGVVTFAAAPAGPALAEDMRVKISGVAGMTLADGVYTVNSLNASTGEFALHDSDDVAIDTTSLGSYTADSATLSIGYKLRFQGQRRLGDFSSDSDVCTLPHQLVKAQALVWAAAEYKREWAQVYEAYLRKYFSKIRGDVHRGNRYIPHGRNRRSTPVEAIRPILIP